MSKHNKKRNVGLVYEMLLQYITENVMNDNQKEAQKAVKIIENRFNKNTELYKEFRLFNALANCKVSGTHIAAGVLEEAKHAARRLDKTSLEKEKSLLIKDINYQLNESTFFHRRINKFRDYATVQSLLNEWMLNDKSNLSKMIEYEKKLIESLVDNDNIQGEIEFDDRSDKLVFKVMSEKINEKYSQTLLPEQKDIIRNYAIYANDPKSLEYFLTSVKSKTISNLKEFKLNLKNKVLLGKIGKVEKNISSLKTENVDDSDISKYLTLINLKHEITRKENEWYETVNWVDTFKYW